MPKNIIISASNKCYVKCPGCYNFFARDKNCVDNSVILDFLSFIKKLKIIDKITISGGDPLLREDIFILLKKIKEQGFNINLDTVGIGILNVNNADVDILKKTVNFIGIPLDGSSQSIVGRFRAGRVNLFEDIKEVITKLIITSIPICINTVVHNNNKDDLLNIGNLLMNYPNVIKWQLFQYMPTGPGGYKNRNLFNISDDVFEYKISELKIAMNDNLSKIEIDHKSKKDRKGIYLLVDTTGVAWTPLSAVENNFWDDNNDSNDKRIIFGNIKNRNDYSKIANFVIHNRIDNDR